jgi:hypothetical protein
MWFFYAILYSFLNFSKSFTDFELAILILPSPHGQSRGKKIAGLKN